MHSSAMIRYHANVDHTKVAVHRAVFDVTALNRARDVHNWIRRLKRDVYDASVFATDDMHHECVLQVDLLHGVSVSTESVWDDNLRRRVATSITVTVVTRQLHRVLSLIAQYGLTAS